MDLPLTRELARLASVLEVLKAQREAFSELSDIKEFRGLEFEFGEAVKEAQGRGLVTQDPVRVVRADWERMVRWSNRVQETLREVDELGQRLSVGVTGQVAEKGGKRKQVQSEWKPEIVELRELEQALHDASARLVKVIDQARGEVQEVDWTGQRPYAELTEVAEALGWRDTLELAEPLGKWAEGVPPRERPLVATRLTTEIGSQMLRQRMESLQMKLAQVRSLQEKHANHASGLEEVGRLTDAGEVATARRAMGALPVCFNDLDYRGKEQNQAKLEDFEKRLKQQTEKVAETRERLEALGRKAGAFFVLPPIGFLSEINTARSLAETVVAQTVQLGKIGGDGEIDRKVSESTAGLKSELDGLRTLSMSRVRRWISVTIAFWLVVLVAGGVTFQQVRAKQERQQAEAAAKAKVAAEAKRVAAEKLQPETDIEERRRRTAGEAWAVEGVGLVLVPIAGGTFSMGSRSGRSNEQPVTTVTLRPFWLAKTEVTQAQWEAVMGSNPSHFKGGQLPVERVSWNDAMEFCQKLTEQERQAGRLPTGTIYTLPTEAQWEYACRAGTTGDYAGDLDAMAWYDKNSGKATHKVGTKQANAWVLHDMHGNVEEWCLDWYGLYLGGRVTDPKGVPSGSFRVSRGGCWGIGANYARSAGRNCYDPVLRYYYFGFRPARSSGP